MEFLLRRPGNCLAGFFVCSLFLLGGCATTTIAADPLKLTAQSIESPVAVSITANTGQVAGFTEITLMRAAPAVKQGEQAPPKEFFVMRRVAPALARDTALFVGAIPPGDYTFYRLRDGKSMRFLNLNANSSMLAPFRVEAGKPADLGRMIVTPINEKVLFGRSAQQNSNGVLMQRFAPEYGKLFGAATSPGWTGPRTEMDLVEEYARLRPVGAACITELPDGSIAAASRLGGVLVRSPFGRWKVLKSPSLDSVACVLPVNLPNAELIAVGDFGMLLRKARGSDKLEQMDLGNLPPGNLIHLSGNVKSGWYVFVQNGDDLTLFRSAQLEAGDWTAVRKENVSFSFWNGTNLLWAWQEEGGMGYALSSGEINLLDFATGAWTQRRAPKQDRLVAFNRSQGGTIGILTSPGGGLGGAFAGVYYSRDLAQTWTPMEVPFNVKVSPVMQLADGRMVMAGGLFSKPELQISSDSGKTWTHHADYDLSRTVLPLSSGTLLDFDQAQYGIFTIRSSVDQGRHWIVEYSNFDRAAYDLQKKK
jgi:hypothetical protein